MNTTLSKTKIVICMPLLLILFISTGYSQQRKMLKPEDYKLWSDRLLNFSSEDGNWVSYKEIFANLKNTLQVKNTVTGLTYNFPDLKTGTFSQDSKWFVFQHNDSLNLLELNSGKKQIFTDIVNFQFIAGGSYLLTTKVELKGTTIVLRNLKTMATHTIINVKEYSFNENKTAIGIVISELGINSVKLVKVKSGFPEIILAEADKNNFSGLSWNKGSYSLMFYKQRIVEEKPVIQNIYVCRNLKEKPIINVLNPISAIGFPKGWDILTSGMFLSNDSKQIFLIFNNPKDNKSILSANAHAINNVKIWTANDKQLPPATDQSGSSVKQYTWWIDSGNLVRVTDDEHPNTVLTGNQKKALLYNNTDYLPQYKYKGDYIDVYIKDLLNGEKKLLVKKILNSHYQITVSPDGRYVTYFKDKQWWSYDIDKDKTECLTKDLSMPFEDVEYDWAGEKPPFGQSAGYVGWLSDDSEIFLYDQFDIWLMNPDGSKKTRITTGRDANITYRIYTEARSLPPGSTFGFTPEVFEPNQNILITSINNSNLDEGLYSWNEESGLQILVKKNRRLQPLQIKIDAKIPFLYKESDFDISPRIMVRYPSGKEQLIYQSNNQQKDYYWGKSELITYTVDGKQLKGALFYPANYNPAKKYPMIVNIYERKSILLHRYLTPSVNEGGGFNVTNYTLDGYFVLTPDISYKLNDPGISATKCVVAATEKVISSGLIDQHAIGLTGHSFGGYETAFIVSQTNMFKAAIAGAPPTDLVDGYLALDLYGQSNMWRFETQQMRLEAPYYGEDFNRNSTIMHTQNINTPLLLWTGDKDTQVNWNNSPKLHSALWRLGKTSALLIYPNEGHVLMNEVNQRDVTLKMKNWFDYYLKDEKPAEWMHITEPVNN